ncbi:uncharacterized protein LOC114287699 isoform X1 [Camellia sinensis]|uniref:uncharacterized protein LOC114287699 isoform X1 n=1 Tax=Camellia sinensis TaxID=4442 RepID=UPI00103651DB|nr:uncharacterized protein LOC114287699 isoform X1 [Camellia sinensis]
MDQIKQHNNQTLVQFSQFHISKKSIQILLFSISLFSFLLSCSPLGHFLSSFSMQLFSYTSDRNYIFLFCNGILVFLIKNSGMTDTCSSSTDPNYEHAKQDKNEDERGRECENLVTDGDGESEILTTQQDGIEEEEEEEEEEDEFVVVYHEEEENGLLSAEELNKKCEDFIRKVKEGIKIEAQQLIIV